METQVVKAAPREFAEYDGSTYRRSAEIGELAAAMVAVQAELRNPRKNQTAQIVTKTGGKYSYSYADLAATVDVCRENLSKHGLAVLQPTSISEGAVTVTTLLVHKSGQWISSDLRLASPDLTPQGIGSTMSYARRYGLTGMVGIAGEDDDGTGKAGRAAQNSIGDHRVPEVRTGEQQAPTDAVLALWKRMNNTSTALAEFAGLKAHFRSLGSGGELEYYRILESNGVHHANEFKRLEDGRKAAAKMLVALQSLEVAGVST